MAKLRAAAAAANGAGLLACLALVLAAYAAPAAAAGQWCHDLERDTVTPLTNTGCAGKVVDQAEADVIRARRTDQVRRAMGAAAVPPPVGAGRRMISIGTGFFISADGKLLSNNHVVQRCAEVTVNAPDGRSLPARVMATAPEIDLALLDTATAPSAFASFRAGPLPVPGTDVVFVGYPNQGRAPVRPLMTLGTLLGAERPEPAIGAGPTRLAFKADVRHGNSGGPLFDRSGLVIGVVHAKLDSPKLYRETGRVVVDIGFAIAEPATAQFLERHGVKLTTAQPGPDYASETLQAAASRMVARVDCWQ